MRTVILHLTLIFFFSTISLAEVIKIGSFQAYSDGINVTLRWVTEDETNVARFEIERSSGNDGNFVMIGALDVKGSSLYEFVDNSAFRRITTLYQYRVKVVFSNGANPFFTAPLTVSHTVSGVRRTWGSIKSMFR
ncbi:MAG: hypothetical protein HYR76_04695 [Ignavibacteria bacterium]|nr:hypothetical protein [Ignavibacteria bacterium]